MPSRIVIFAKAPLPGRVKTRLVPALGEEGAARLAHRMLLDTYRQAASVLIASVEICASPEPSHADWKGLLPSRATRLTAQGEGDLGERLACATERVLGEGERIVLIGTDCPGLTESHLREACLILRGHDAVIHPTLDGGYALLGLRRFDPSLFSGIGWSGPDVAKDTIVRIEALGWSLRVGETLRDVDEPEDLTTVMLNLFQHPATSRLAGGGLDPETSSG